MDAPKETFELYNMTEHHLTTDPSEWILNSVIFPFWFLSFGAFQDTVIVCLFVDCVTFNS